jgi:hypothetical protein
VLVVLVLVVDVEVVVVVVDVVPPLPIPIIVAMVVVVVVVVVDVLVVLVFDVVVVVVVVVVVDVVVVVGASQEHASSRRHCRRARSAMRTALRPHSRRALPLKVVHDRLIDTFRVRRHLLRPWIVRRQLPGRPGTSSAQMPYCTLKSWVRLWRFSIRGSASSQSSTRLRVRSKQLRQASSSLHLRADAAGGVPSNHPHARTAISTPLGIRTPLGGTRRPADGQLEANRRAWRSSYMPWNIAGTSIGASHASPRSSR